MQAIEVEQKYSVSEFIQEVASFVSGGWAGITLTGEVAQFTRASSGHWYFTLKDDKAQIKAVMFRQKNIRVGFFPKQGDQVEVTATASIYESRGDLQLICDSLRKAGQGSLYERYIALREKLLKEGLFEVSRKKKIPPVAFSIGVVTSPQAAAWADIQTALQRRLPHAKVVLYPTSVQGDAANAQIVRAIGRADEAGHDVLIIGRGGGSLEDLWCFNEELVVRAVSACSTPTIVGVGHESDTTLAEFAADLRAATPTAAVELASQTTDSLLAFVDGLFADLDQRLERRLLQAEQRVDRADLSLVSPQDRLSASLQKITRLSEKMQSSVQVRLLSLSHKLNQSSSVLQRRPGQVAERQALRFSRLAPELLRARDQGLRKNESALKALEQILEAVSPERNLEKGYAFLQKVDTSSLVSRTDQVQEGDSLVATLSDGQLQVTVSGKRMDRPHPVEAIETPIGDRI